LRTQSYQALDETDVEWRGIPGHRYSGYITSFFTPLPRHAWSAISPQELLTADQSSRTPLGWGAYKIDEWTAGDHISLSRNPGYFRSGEGLPHFEHLVFRFISDPAEALAALEAGECDYLDETIRLQSLGAKIEEAQANGKLVSLRQPGTAWEHLDFGIAPLDPSLLPIFQAREARQAVALCTDRQKIAAELFPGQPVALDSYIPADHPLFNPDARRYSFDPGAANSLLESIGWSDEDGNAATPRRSQGVAGIPDGTPFEIRFLTSEEPEKVRVGEILRDSLAQCGITLNVSSLPDEQLFATGSEAPIFGRRFYLVQYAWMGAWQPPCYLYTTQEIPGPYPQYQKGWGGSNPSGYSSADFDRACSRALAIMPEQPEFQAAHFLAQSIFADDLPSLPLYLHTKQVAHRPELCGVSLESSTDSVLWNLESFVYGESCPQ
jgi:peptide/nickel transport system substrate-binding protein